MLWQLLWILISNTEVFSTKCEFGSNFLKNILNNLFEKSNQLNRISDLKNGGFIDYWRVTENRKLAKKGELTTKSDTSASDKVDDHVYHEILMLDQLQSAIYLFILGQTLSLIIILIEFSYKRYKQSSMLFYIVKNKI